MKFTKHHLTPGEAFHLWHRQSGLTERQIADMYQVSPRTLRNWIRDKGTPPNVLSELPEPLPPWYICYTLRRRVGMTVRSMARTFDVSFQTLSRWENGEADWERLVEYYRKLGWDI